MAVLNLLGLLLSLIGGILLFYALNLEASNFKLTEQNNHEVAICLNDKMVEAGYGGTLRVSVKPCPPSIAPSRTPTIVTEHPTFVTCGLGFIILGFVLQLPSASVALTQKQ